MKSTAFVQLLRMPCSILAVILGCSAVAHSGVVSLGIISFDVLTPSGPGSPGVNVFDISNLTGNPVSGGFALPLDFTAFTSINFSLSTLQLVSGGSMETINLGTIAPGPVGAISSLEFPSTTTFSSAVFSATLGTSSILLSNGTTFSPAYLSFTTTLLPSAAASLVAGSDFAVVTVTDVPEVGTSGGLLIGVFMLIALSRVSAFIRRFELPVRTR